MPEFEPPVPDTPRLPRRRSRLAAVSARLGALPRWVRGGLAVTTAIAAVAVTGTAGDLTRDTELHAGPTTRFDLAYRGPVLDLPGAVSSLDLGPDGGVALAVRCGGTGCRHNLAVSRGGRWQARTLPPTAEPELVAAVLLPGGGILVYGETARWFSADAGRSWRPVPGRHTAPVERVNGDRLVVMPPAQHPDVASRAHPARCAGGRVGVISRRTGGTAPLAHQPRLDVCWAAAFGDPAGWHWVTGTDPATGRPAAAYSADGGASWRVLPLAASGADVVGVEVFWSGSRRYAVTLAGRYPARNLVRGLHALRSPGWREVARWPSANLLAIRGQPVPRHDGSLLAVDGGGTVLVSRDDGTTFSRIAGRLRLGPVIRTPGGWLTQVQDVTYPWLYSRDGFTWRRLPVR